AEALEIDRPRSLQGMLAELAQQKRLSGAIPFVAQLVSALSLPPRRLTVPELPLGGYSDVSTRGQPEHLLPSQFALDDLEFVRRGPPAPAGVPAIRAGRGRARPGPAERAARRVAAGRVPLPGGPRPPPGTGAAAGRSAGALDRRRRAGGVPVPLRRGARHGRA